MGIRASPASRSMSCSRRRAGVHARAGGLRALLRADARELGVLRERYWREVREAGLEVAGKVFVDKHPLHSLKLPLIARLFPNAKILFAYRDPRDVVLSCFRRRFNMNPAMYQLLTLEGAAAFYDATMQLADAGAAAAGAGLARRALREPGR